MAMANLWIALYARAIGRRAFRPESVEVERWWVRLGRASRVVCEGSVARVVAGFTQVAVKGGLDASMGCMRF